MDSGEIEVRFLVALLQPQLEQMAQRLMQNPSVPVLSPSVLKGLSQTEVRGVSEVLPPRGLGLARHLKTRDSGILGENESEPIAEEWSMGAFLPGEAREMGAPEVEAAQSQHAMPLTEWRQPQKG